MPGQQCKGRIMAQPVRCELPKVGAGALVLRPVRLDNGVGQLQPVVRGPGEIPWAPASRQLTAVTCSCDMRLQFPWSLRHAVRRLRLPAWRHELQVRAEPSWKNKQDLLQGGCRDQLLDQAHDIPAVRRAPPVAAVDRDAAGKVWPQMCHEKFNDVYGRERQQQRLRVRTSGHVQRSGLVVSA